MVHADDIGVSCLWRNLKSEGKVDWSLIFRLWNDKTVLIACYSHVWWLQSSVLLDPQGHLIPKIHFLHLARVELRWMDMGMVTHQVLRLTTILHLCSALHLRQMHLPHTLVSLVDWFVFLAGYTHTHIYCSVKARVWMSSPGLDGQLSVCEWGMDSSTVLRNSYCFLVHP